MHAKHLLISIHPKYAAKIFEGTKTVELRRVFPSARPINMIVVYVTTPVKAVAGVIHVERVVAHSPRGLWTIVKDKAGVTHQEFSEYYSGSEIGYGIFIKDVIELTRPIPLSTLRDCWEDFQPPQSYRYLSQAQLTEVMRL